MPDTRIPLEDFASFSDARLNGAGAGGRWLAAMDAQNEILARNKAERAANQPQPVDWRDVYVVGWNKSHP